MDTLSYKTKSANKNTVHKRWVLVDATDQTLGRLSSKVAKLLRGKYKVDFTPHVDCGDNVVIINAEKIRLTGKKWDQKIYERYSGYQSGKRQRTAREIHGKHPTGLVEKAVKRMLPKNRLGRRLFNNLHVFAGAEHDKEAQKPEPINIDDLK